MTNNGRKTWALMIGAAIVSVATLSFANTADNAKSRIRVGNSRIAEVFRFAHDRSGSFGDLVATLDALDTVVYVEEGRCHHRELRACLVLMPTPGGRHLLIRIDPRQQMRSVVAQLAHGLYHAVEIARTPGVIDEPSLRVFYETYGERACAAGEDCWETRAAVAFEALVNRETRAAPLSTRRH